MPIQIQKPSLGQEELEAVKEVFATGWLGMGAVTREFEEQVKKFLGVKNVIAVNTGTSALHIALDAFGIGEGDEVIVPSLTFAGSIQAILMCGAIPVFCDVYSDTLNMDVEDVMKRTTSKTKAIMPVHYSGLPCQIDEIIKIAKEKKILVIEDAAHAFGSTYKGKKIGTFGDVTCFSFDPIKTITCGEGGATVTDNDEIAKKIILKRILGIDKETWFRYQQKRSWYYEVKTLGFRYHMSNVNAAIGLEQLKKIDRFIQKKQKIVRKYDDAFQGMKKIELLSRNYEETAPFNYIIKVKKAREELMNFLKENDVIAGVHYIPNHTQPFFRKYYTPLPVTEKIGKEILTLPLYYDMTDDDVNKVIDCVWKFFKEKI